MKGAPPVARKRLQPSDNNNALTQEYFSAKMEVWGNALPFLTTLQQRRVDLTSLPESKAEWATKSWVKGVLDEKGVFKFGCEPCEHARSGGAAAAGRSQARKFASMQCSGRTSFQLCHLKFHQTLQCHIDNANAYFGLTGSSTSKPDTVPTAEGFRKVWDHICKGGSPFSGVEGVGQANKVQKMIWFSLNYGTGTHEQISLGGCYPFGSSVDPYFDLGNPGAISYPLAWFHKSVRRGSRSANN